MRVVSVKKNQGLCWHHAALVADWKVHTPARQNAYHRKPNLYKKIYKGRRRAAGGCHPYTEERSGGVYGCEARKGNCSKYRRAGFPIRHKAPVASADACGFCERESEAFAGMTRPLLRTGKSALLSAANTCHRKNPMARLREPALSPPPMTWALIQLNDVRLRPAPLGSFPFRGHPASRLRSTIRRPPT
jgi:hypothetical protein